MRCRTAGMGAGGKTSLEEVAAGGGFPIDHFTGDEDAGEFFEHEVGVKFVPCNTSGAGNGLFDWSGTGEGDVAVFDFMGKLRG